ncbi:MAG: PqqD family protein [Acidobacteria bacterium]|nr:PqqD family protein [Acidobacteriota bacterium]
MNEARLRVSQAVRASTSSDGLVLLDVHGGLLLASNSVGAHIWALIEQQRTPCEIARQLSTDYGITIERAERDAAAFVSALIARGLVIEEAVC